MPSNSSVANGRLGLQQARSIGSIAPWYGDTFVRWVFCGGQIADDLLMDLSTSVRFDFRRLACPIRPGRPDSGELAQRPECRAEFGSEDFRFFPRSEVAAPVELVEVGEAGVGWNVTTDGATTGGSP